MQRHRTARTIATIIMVAAGLYLVATVAGAIIAGSGGAGLAWGTGWRGWLVIPLVITGTLGAVSLFVFGAVLYFVSEISNNTFAARARGPIVRRRAIAPTPVMETRLEEPQAAVAVPLPLPPDVESEPVETAIVPVEPAAGTEWPFEPVETTAGEHDASVADLPHVEIEDLSVAGSVGDESMRAGEEVAGETSVVDEEMYTSPAEGDLVAVQDIDMGTAVAAIDMASAAEAAGETALPEEEREAPDLSMPAVSELAGMDLERTVSAEELPASDAEMPAAETDLPALEDEIYLSSDLLPDIEDETPALEAEFTRMDIETPAVEVEPPAMEEVEAPATGAEFPVAEAELSRAEADLPRVDLEAPEVATEDAEYLREVESEAAEASELSPYETIDTPLMETVTMEPGETTPSYAEYEGPEVDLTQIDMGLPESEMAPARDATFEAEFSPELELARTELPEESPIELPAASPEPEVRTTGEATLPAVDVPAAQPDEVASLRAMVAELSARLARIESGTPSRSEQPPATTAVPPEAGTVTEQPVAGGTPGRLPGTDTAARIAAEMAAAVPARRRAARGPQQEGAGGEGAGGPAGGDDFSLITGVGPTYAQRLRAKGITTYAQLADASYEALDEVTNGNLERVLRQDWRGQARRFAQHRRSTDE
jgi:predicted flap endonuclease-1-like 5' DNA nuclease